MKRFLFIIFFVFFISAEYLSSDIRLETIGVLGGQNLYFIYTTIGLLADNFNNNIYDSNFSTQLSKDIIASCKRSKNYFQNLLDENILTGNDIQFGNNMVEAYDNLISEANAFISTIESSNSETTKQFNKYKTKAWDKIQSILKLEE